MSIRVNVNPGDKYGRFTVIREVDKRGIHRLVLCRCSCGTEKVMNLHGLRTSNAKSCGCLHSEVSAARFYSHGFSETPIYKVWTAMKQRCLNVNNPVYKHYGGRGITVCNGWKDFVIFHKWALSSGYKQGLTIERIDVNGNYEPKNCTWIPKTDQPKNTRRTKMLEYDGETKSLWQWSTELNVDRKLIKSRLQHGWSIERSIEEPFHKDHSHKRIT